MKRFAIFFLVIALLVIGFSLQPFDVSHPLSVTKECVQGLPVCSKPMLVAAFAFLFVLIGFVITQPSVVAVPLHEHQFYDPQSVSPVIDGLRKGRLARRDYN